MSGAGSAGSERRNPPHSAKFEVSAPPAPPAVAPGFAQQARTRADRQAEGVQAARLVAEHEVRMVLQVSAHAGQMDAHGQAQAGERVPGADARQHQDLGRLQCAGRQQHFAPGAQGAQFAVLAEFNTHGARAVE